MAIRSAKFILGVKFSFKVKVMPGSEVHPGSLFPPGSHLCGGTEGHEEKFVCGEEQGRGYYTEGADGVKLLSWLFVFIIGQARRNILGHRPGTITSPSPLPLTGSRICYYRVK